MTTDDFPEIPDGKIGVFIGAHQSFNEEETAAIDAFCESNNAIVICDQVSNYRGKYRFLASLVNNQGMDLGMKRFDLIVYIGSVHGAYISFSSKQLWRVNSDGVIRDPYKNLTCVFEMDEIDFFRHYTAKNGSDDLIVKARAADANLRTKLPELPFSNMWIAKETAGLIPDHAILHVSILNTLRVWNYFETKETVLCYTNSGGYGIDGCLSSCIGSALANPDKEHYFVVGDLSFFYDINTLYHSIPANVHILLVNNGVGTEFKNYSHRASYFGDDADRFMAAKGHNGFKSPELVRSMCADLHIKYLFAGTKKEYLTNRDAWLAKGSVPVLLEVFTDDKNESDALKQMNSIVVDTSLKAMFSKTKLWKAIKKVIRG